MSINLQQPPANSEIAHLEYQKRCTLSINMRRAATQRLVGGHDIDFLSQ